MAQEMSGKVAVVTGAGGGIGGAIALDLAAEGAKVVVNDIDKKDADKVVKDIQKAKGIAVANYDTVATMTGGENIINAATENFGRIDILVNTAGFSRRGYITELSEDNWDSVIAVHLKGHFACSKPAVAAMIKQKSGGRIINFSSLAGFAWVDVPFFGISYATAKAGVVGFTARLSAEMKQHGITVNAIFPNARTKGFPDERPGAEAPEFVSPIVVYLCTEEAKDITGHLFTSSGGTVGIYARPMQGKSAQVMKMGKWTLDELSMVIPPMVAQMGK